MLINVALSRPYKVPGYTHRIVACLGELYIKANYPNAYPVT